MITCVLELQTKVRQRFAKILLNHGEGPYWDLLLVESAYCLLRDYPKQASNSWYVDVKLGCKGHK